MSRFMFQFVTLVAAFLAALSLHTGAIEVIEFNSRCQQTGKPLIQCFKESQ
jgi:hypothetical protein